MENLLVAIITAVGLIITQVAISYRQNNIILYRIDQLEKKQDKHNKLMERTYEVEKKIDIQEEQIKVANHRISDLEGEN